jgi:hypothetical protein
MTETRSNRRRQYVALGILSLAVAGLMGGRFGPYLCDSEGTSWLKIRNRSYSQMMGRNELLNRMAEHDRTRQSTETDSCAGCVLACVEAEMY